MERKYMSNNLKDSRVFSCNNKLMKDWWNCNGQGYGEEDNYLAGFSWPPRSYTCSFCKREFKSAQALGGHMNVHRRDRARLRQSSPPSREVIGNGKYPLINLNVNPSPNPNLSSSSSSPPERFSLQPSKLPCMVSSPIASTSSASPSDVKICEASCAKRANISSMKAAKASYDYGDHDGGYPRNKCMFNKTESTTVRLDLEIGVFRGYEEDLDLELRLGCP